MSLNPVGPADDFHSPGQFASCPSCRRFKEGLTIDSGEAKERASSTYFFNCPDARANRTASAQNSGAHDGFVLAIVNSSQAFRPQSLASTNTGELQLQWTVHPRVDPVVQCGRRSVGVKAASVWTSPIPVRLGPRQ